MTNYQDLIKATICPFLQYCNDVQINERDFSHCLHITLRVHRADHSKVIGAGGKMVKALTLLFVSAGQRNKQPISFEVLEPVVGQKEKEEPFEKDPEWDRHKDLELGDKIEPIIEGVTGKNGLSVRSDKRGTTISLSNAVSPEIAGALGTIVRAIGKSSGREVLLKSDIT